MRVKELSNHPLAQVRALQAAIDEAQRRRDEHLEAVRVLRLGNAASRRWWQWVRWWRHRRREAELRAAAPRPDPAMRHELARYQAGAEAEYRAMCELKAGFDDGWALFLGYTNRRGEVDLLLVGPGGVWAIEVKNLAVRVHVDGDRWTFDKYDRYGNRVDSGELRGGGRSWGRQVGDVADELAAFLRRRGSAVDVRKAVVLMHDRAEIGTCRDLRVTLSRGTASLIESIRRAPTSLSASRQAEVEHLIHRDHSFNTRRRHR